ncbi:fusaric acid resistance protein [Tamilnaduibacter salinus]|uniref:Fusaric acid resistance protein n=1 Tax=Tamilnaduibacter salinus TaxID=1484056 RepID=A0A2A2I781_9GAMM|nr:FUSC family protein [Tamilnaduibacter salinus]PAV27248.1 fusaric acid resistance protein [Tamilnaduibacter salinus]
MTLHPLLAQLLMPDRSAVIFALKGVIAMALAVCTAMFLQLDRPYWAVVSAVFLQIRPESGLVVEKAICQVLGSVVGGGVGILILAVLMPYPVLALACLALWVGLNSAASSMVHSVNFIYAFAMAGVTAGLVVLLVMADASTTSSAAVFAIAKARISEIAIGALCAMLVSRLLWPRRVKDGLRRHARSAINRTMDYLSLELDPASSHDQRHDQADQILEILVALNDDSSAVVYEGAEGPGRSRAASLLCNKILSLLAVTQIIGRFHRYHSELVSPAFAELLGDMRRHFREIAEADGFENSYKRAQSLRRALRERRATMSDESAIVRRLTQTSLELVSDLVVVLRAYNALENRDRTLLKTPRLRTHRDPLIGLVNGFRTVAVFLVGAVVWVHTASPAAIMMMVMPVVFSIMFARLPSAVLTVALRRLLSGVCVAIPVALFFGLGLLSRASHDIEMLLLILAGPYFVGLLLLADRATLPYGLGLCIPFTLIVQPSNPMTIQADTAVSTALGLLAGISVLYWVFKLVGPPDREVLQHRLLKATARDLEDIDHHEQPEHWFNGRMGERLLRLANYDQSSGGRDRSMTDLGFTGLNLGHVSIRLRRRIQAHRSPAVDALLEQWQTVLAETYEMSARGQYNPEFRAISARLLNVIQAAGLAETDVSTIEGLFERVALTLERTARTVAPEPPETARRGVAATG